MTESEARKLGEEDAALAVKIAREESLGGTLDPKRLRIPHPSSYRDTAELPGRRIATEWGNGLPVDEGIVPPPVLTKFGRAAQVYDAGGDANWAAYTQAIEEALRDADVMHIETLHLVYGRAVNEDWVKTVRSTYVVDLNRYEVTSVLRVADPFTPDMGTLPLELDLMNAIVPRNLSRFERARRRRQNRRYPERAPL